jgi:hypothetical protein
MHDKMSHEIEDYEWYDKIWAEDESKKMLKWKKVEKESCEINLIEKMNTCKIFLHM